MSTALVELLYTAFGIVLHIFLDPECSLAAMSESIFHCPSRSQMAVDDIDDWYTHVSSEIFRWTKKYTHKQASSLHHQLRIHQYPSASPTPCNSSH